MTDHQSSMSEENRFAITAHSLTKYYKNEKSPALNEFSLQVKEGDFFGLLGPNGAGKTTAIAILSDLIKADSGSLSLAGLNYRENKKEIQYHLGLVPQEIALYDNLTARENLIYFARHLDLSGKSLKDQVEKCLFFAALQEKSESYVSTFSGGMKRRLNLAAALLHSPQLLFLDEPTVGIDAQSRNLIHEQLKGLNREGMTILYTTHYMEEAQELCNTIGIIDGGRMIQQGTSEDLLAEHSCKNLEELFLNLTGRKLRDQ